MQSAIGASELTTGVDVGVGGSGVAVGVGGCSNRRESDMQ